MTKMNGYRFMLFKEQRGRCHYCNVQMTTDEEGPFHCTTEHKVPVSKGGSNYRKNLVGACYKCNNARGSVDYHTFRKYISIYGNVRFSETYYRISDAERALHSGMWGKIMKEIALRPTGGIVNDRPYRRAFLHLARRNLEKVVAKYTHRERSDIYLEGRQNGYLSGTQDRTVGQLHVA